MSAPTDGRPRVVCLWRPGEALRAHLDAALSDAVDLVWPAAATPDEAFDGSSVLEGASVEGSAMAAARAGADAFLGWRVTEALVEAAGPRLRLVVNPGAGVRHLYKPLAARRDVIVLNSHGNADATAQHAVALLLALMGRVVPHDAWMRAGRWQTGDGEATSWLLSGRTVALCGLGHVGRRIARKLVGFDVRVEAVCARPERARGDGSAAPDLPGVAAVHGPDGLADLLERASVLLLALPHTPATEGMIGRAELERLGPDGLLVNVGRGPVVDEAALYAALSSRVILGAALDVFWNYRPEGEGAGPADEPRYPYDAASHPFHALENVVLSPHRAASPFDDLARWRDVISALRLFAREGAAAPFPNRVDLSRGY